MKASQRTLIIVGAGGHGKVCADCATLLGQWQKIVFLDSGYPEKQHWYGCEVVGHTDALSEFVSDQHDFFVAIGDNHVRARLIAKIESLNANLTNLIHPSAAISDSVKINVATLVLAQCAINADTTVGKGCIVNTGAKIDHDCIIDDYVHLGPGVSLAGSVQVGEKSFLGIGSCAIPQTKIGECTIVGAGATVTSDIESDCTVVGTPARKIIK